MKDNKSKQKHTRYIFIEQKRSSLVYIQSSRGQTVKCGAPDVEILALMMHFSASKEVFQTSRTAKVNECHQKFITRRDRRSCLSLEYG